MNSKITNLSKRLCLAAVLIMILFAAISHYDWAKRDSSMCGVDVANHLLSSIEFFDELSDIMQKSVSPVGTKITETISLLSYKKGRDVIYWPNGLNFTASAFYSFFGRSIFSAKLSLLPYLFVLLFSTYLIGKLIYSKLVGILAVFLIFMYPIIFQSSRQFQLDFPLTAMVVLSILFLLKCDNFRNTKYSLLLGISSGWAMLIKGQAALFITWPLLIILHNILRDHKQKILKKEQVHNISFFVIIAGLITWIWWGQGFKEIGPSLWEHIFDKFKALESYWVFDDKYTFSSIFFYLKTLFNSLGFIFFGLFSISFLLFLKQKVKYKRILLSWLILPFLLFNFLFTIKHTRFLMPVFPVIALVTSWGLFQIKKKKIRIPILLGVIIFSLGQFYVLSYRDWGYPKIGIGPLKVFGRTNYETFSPHAKYFKIDEVVQAIRKHTPPRQPVKIGSIIAFRGKPRGLETIVWLKLSDRFLIPSDLIEMHKTFRLNLDSLDFILIRAPLKFSLWWAQTGKLAELISKRYSREIASQLRNKDYFWWEKYNTLKFIAFDFHFVKKIVIDEENGAYFIYQRDAKSRF